MGVARISDGQQVFRLRRSARGDAIRSTVQLRCTRTRSCLSNSPFSYAMASSCYLAPRPPPSVVVHPKMEPVLYRGAPQARSSLGNWGRQCKMSEHERKRRRPGTAEFQHGLPAENSRPLSPAQGSPPWPWLQAQEGPTKITIPCLLLGDLVPNL